MILSTLTSTSILMIAALLAVIWIVVSLIRRRSNQLKLSGDPIYRSYLSHNMNESTALNNSNKQDDILQIPVEVVARPISQVGEEILEIPSVAREPEPAVQDGSVIDVTGQSAMIPPPPQQIAPRENIHDRLKKCETGVPAWTHHYVYSASELNHASKNQRSFYVFFREAFAKGVYYDLEGNTNYAFILLFDIIEAYEVGDNLPFLEKHLEKLGEHYPKTKPYVRSSLHRRMVEIGDSVGLERWREQQDRENIYYRSNYVYEPWGFGSSRKKRLNLSAAAVKLLDSLRYPSNNFLSIEYCGDQIIGLFLQTEKDLSAAYKSTGRDLDSIFNEMADVIARKEYRFRTGSANYNYSIQSTHSDLHTLVFKSCENAVRELCGIKRRLQTAFYKNEVAKNEVEDKLLSILTPIISLGICTVKPPDEATEVLLNAQNSNRWKIAFEKITYESGLTGPQIVERVLSLASLNKENPAIENIFFEASKYAASIDRKSSLVLYVYYLYYDLRSVKFDNRKFSKTIQKSLFTTNEQLHEFERIISELISSNDLEKALAAVSEVYVQKRREITLNPRAIEDVRHKHSDTVELLNEYLHDEFEDEQNAIVSTETGGGEIQIEITSKHDIGQSSAAASSVELNPAQLGMLQLFAKNNFSLSQSEVETFARENALFRNQLIESINDMCFETLDDVLIEEEDEEYVIDENYFRMIIQI